MSTHPLVAAMRRFTKTKCTKPAGSYTVDECAKAWGCSDDKAKSLIVQMVKASEMVEVKGSRVNGLGQIVACVYYKPAKVKATK